MYSANYKNKILNFAVIFIAIIAGFNIYKKQIKIVDSLKQKKELETRKNRILVGLLELEKKINFYKDFVNKKDISSVVNTLNSIAKESGVKIISLKPLEEQTFPLYTKYPFSLTLNARTYDDIGVFISNLENSGDIYVITSVAIKPARAPKDGSSEDQKNDLVLELALNTFLFKSR